MTDHGDAYLIQQVGEYGAITLIGQPRPEWRYDLEQFGPSSDTQGNDASMPTQTLRERMDDDDRLWKIAFDAGRASVGWCPCANNRPQDCKPEQWPLSSRHGIGRAEA